MKLSIVTCAACMRPFARSSCGRFTTPGMTAFVALSKRVSPSPKTSVPTKSAHRLICPVAVRIASHSATAPRMPLATAMMMRRSNRSTIMPAGSPKTSHGRKASAPMTEIGQRIAGQRRGDERHGRSTEPVGEVAERGGRPELAEIAAERSPCVPARPPSSAAASATSASRRRRRRRSRRSSRKHADRAARLGARAERRRRRTEPRQRDDSPRRRDARDASGDE